jgi:hypothetical protein
MTTISQIITDAYRESNLIAVGASPTTAEQTEALRLLNRVVISLFGNELGDPLKVLPLGKNNIQTPTNINFYMDDILQYYVPLNTRLQCNLEAETTVNLIPNPQDGSRFSVVDSSDNLATHNLVVYGNGRMIENATNIVLNTSGLSRDWFYRDDLGEWVRLTDLTLDGDSPFPPEFDDLLITSLALRLAPRQGADFGTPSQIFLTRMEKKFRARYKQTDTADSEEGLIRLASRKDWAYGSDGISFDRGVPR